MSAYEIDENDLDIFLIEYENLYIKELTHYGTIELINMAILLETSLELQKMDDDLLTNYYEKYLEQILNDFENSSIELYYVHKIIYFVIDIILKMTELLYDNANNITLQIYSSKIGYFIGMAESFVNRLLEPLGKSTEKIMKLNKTFYISDSGRINNLKKIIAKNKHMFYNKKTPVLIENLIKMIKTK